MKLSVNIKETKAYQQLLLIASVFLETVVLPEDVKCIVKKAENCRCFFPNDGLHIQRQSIES